MLTGFIYWVKVRFFIVVVAACFQVIAGGFVNNLGLLHSFFQCLQRSTLPRSTQQSYKVCLNRTTRPPENSSFEYAVL